MDNWRNICVPNLLSKIVNIYAVYKTSRSCDVVSKSSSCPYLGSDVPATFMWRIHDVSVFVWNFTFVCTAYQGVCATYV